MSFSVVIRCGRDWTPGDPCRQAEPLGVIAGFADARERARRLGWSTVVQAGEIDGLVDRCPACTRRELEGSVRRRATDRRPVDDAALPATGWEQLARGPLGDRLVAPIVDVELEPIGPRLPAGAPIACTMPCHRRPPLAPGRTR